MASLLQIGIDKSFVMKKGTWYFEYKGVRFKFVQTKRRWSDLLLTIVGVRHSPEEAVAYTVAAEWASALAWELNVPVNVHPVGMAGIAKGVPLRRVRGNIFTFPLLPFQGDIRGYDLNRIARVENEDQRRALALYREARCSNGSMLPILLHWQILEIRGGDVVGWINKTVRRLDGRLYRVADYLRYMKLGARKLGNYLQEDGRHAIAHIKRSPGRSALRLDDLPELQRLGLAAGVLQELAAHYIENNLGVKERLYLIRDRDGVARYLSE